MEPAEQFAAVKDMRAAGFDMLAIYHSHPATAARPSAEDIRLAFTPNIAYVIISLREADAPVARCFVVENGCASDIPLNILEAGAAQPHNAEVLYPNLVICSSRTWIAGRCAMQ